MAEWELSSAMTCRKPITYVKPEAAITVFELLVMSGVSLETVPTQPLQLPATTNVCKTRSCNYIFELLMMSGVSLETC
jgi:hypothetical protein